MNPEVVHSQDADAAAEMIGRLDSVDDLAAVREAEEDHPEYEGGRKTVLEAVDARERELREERETWHVETRTDRELEYYVCDVDGCRFGTFDEELIRGHVRPPHG
ncbi:MAG: hypothetical protein ACOC5E_01930 [Acidobacteriota bacterium]